MTKRKTIKPVKATKGWAITTKRGVVVGGGDKYFGYTELCIYSTYYSALSHLNPHRDDIIIPVLITPIKKK